MRFKSSLLTLILFILSLLVNISCSEVVSNTKNSNNDNNNTAWLIPSDQVYVGAGRDGIASIDNPEFTDISDVDFLSPDDLVLGIKMENQIKAYPRAILNYHEIVNDLVSDIPISITYCPLTGSGIAWKRSIESTPTSFGVSGLIYKNNLIAYDRHTDSYWSQMLGKSVHGLQSGETPETYQLVEMRWEDWKKTYPNSEVLNGEEGSNTTYTSPPYGDYQTNNNNILFPITNEDSRLERKTLAHGIFPGHSLNVFPLKYFPDEFKVINRVINGASIVITGSSKHKLVVSFYRTLKDGTVINFKSTSDSLPVIMEDTQGTKWNIFGEAISGPRKGMKLKSPPSYNAYWFAWADFFGGEPKQPKIVFP